MALVVDHNDPMDLGMFSKPGRFTSEKYIIFQKKDEILNNQRKFLKVTSLPHLKMDFDGKDRKPALDDEDLKPRPTTLSKQRSRPSPFSTQISREEFYEVKVKVKNPPPPCGFYNPKYEHVEKGSRLLFQYDKEKKSDQFRSTMRDFSPEEASKPIPDKLKKKVVGPILFHQQTPKGAITSKTNPHEERFNYLESPKNWGKMKRVLTVDMSKTLKRDTKFLIKDLEYSPDYDPNFEFGKKQLGSPGPRFETHSPRKPMHYSSSCTNENFYDSTKKETLKYFKPRDTFFDKYTSRDWDSSCPLPSFMQKSVNSRIAIGTLRQKTLETNGFSDGKFQTVTTSFFPKK